MRIAEIWRYPVKSLQGEPLGTAAVTGGGIEGDRRFHRAIASAAHNPFLQQLIDQLAPMMDRTSAASLTTVGRPEVSLEAHQEILNAIDAQDEVLASERMRQHVEKSAESLFGKWAGES